MKKRTIYNLITCLTFSEITHYYIIACNYIAKISTPCIPLTFSGITHYSIFSLDIPINFVKGQNGHLIILVKVKSKLFWLFTILSVLTNSNILSMNLRSFFLNSNHIWILKSVKVWFVFFFKTSFWLFTTLTISIILSFRIWISIHIFNI